MKAMRGNTHINNVIGAYFGAIGLKGLDIHLYTHIVWLTLKSIVSASFPSGIIGKRKSGHGSNSTPLESVAT